VIPEQYTKILLNKKVIVFLIGCAVIILTGSCSHDRTEKGDSTGQLNTAEDTLVMKKAIGYYLQDSVSLSREYTMKALELAVEQENISLEIEALNLLGYIYVYWNDYEASLQYFLKSLHKANRMHDLKGQMSALLGLGRTYNMMNASSKALDVLHQSLSICEKNGWNKEAAKMHLEIGNTYTNQKRYDKTLKELEKAYSYSDAAGDTLSMIYILNNMGQSYNQLKDYPRALEFLNQSLGLNKYRGDAQGQSAALGNIGEVYIALGDYPKAIDFINRSIEISERQGFRLFTKDNYLLLSSAYEMNQELEQALKYYKKYTESGDSLFNEEKSKAINAIEFKHAQQEKDQKIAVLEQKSKNRTLLLRFTILAVILAVSVLVLLAITLRLRTKLHKKEKQELGETISHKNRELVSMMLQSSQKEKLLEELEINLQKLSSSKHQDLKGLAEELRHKVKSMQEIDTDWQVLKTHFEEVHPNFFQMLQSRHPDLTQNDLRLCAYIRINLTTKDIARLIHISDRSVQTAKYRIKKKMQLPASSDLTHYITEL